MSHGPFHGTLFGDAHVRQKYINCEGGRRGGREKWSLKVKQLFLPVTIVAIVSPAPRSAKQKLLCASCDRKLAMLPQGSACYQVKIISMKFGFTKK